MLTETKTIDKIEVVGEYNFINPRELIVVERDGVEIARSYHRPGVLTPLNQDGSDTDLTGKHSKIVDMAAAMWTQEVKDAYRLILE